jgi:hypothetical protein
MARSFPNLARNVGYRPISLKARIYVGAERNAGRARPQGAAVLKKPFFPAVIEAVQIRHYGLTALNPERG